VQQQSKLIGKQAITMAQSSEPPRQTPMLEAERVITVDLITTRAHAKGVAPTISHEGGQVPLLPGLARTWPQWPCSWTLYLHPPSMGCTCCIASWGKSLPLPLHHRWSAHIGGGLENQPPAQFALGPTCSRRLRLWNLLQKVHPKAHRGNRVNTLNPWHATRLVMGT
jgi:hypothetical protein